MLRHVAAGVGVFSSLLVATDFASGQAAAFAEVSEAVGLGNFTSVPGDGHAPGAVFTDLNNDGYADVYVVGGKNYATNTPLPNRLFLNVPDNSGGRRFNEVAGAAGAGDTGEHIGAISADYDNDGDQDLYVLNWYFGNDPVSTRAQDQNRLYRNNLTESGSFSYTDITSSTDPTPTVNDDQHGVGWATQNGQSINQSLTGAWGDPDRDGNLDLYVGTHHGFIGWCDTCGLPGQRDTFYKNNGDGTFTDQTVPLGLEGFETASGQHLVPGVQEYSSTNAVVFADLNNDQWPDLFVSNKVGGSADRDLLYINQGADANGEWLGYEPVTYELPTPFGDRSGGAMGVEIADIDNDGDLDIYITDFSSPDNFNGTGQTADGSNDLWINQLSETGELNFIHSSDARSGFSWGTQVEDFDNNGYQDIHVVTEGGLRDSLYLNSENGFTAEVGAAAGFSETLSGRGGVSADYDRDGLIDLLVINPYVTNASVFYENRSDELVESEDFGFISVKLTGDPTLPGQYKSSRDAIGARVIVSADLDGDGVIEDNEHLIREVLSGSSNAASTSSLDLEFGIGLADEVVIEILWPSGRRTVLEGIAADSQLAVAEIGGDFNDDGVVDASDFAVWRDSAHSTVAIAAGGDGNGDGVVDYGDYLLWQASFGATALEYLTFDGSAPLTIASVPEPSTVGLLVISVASGGLARRRRICYPGAMLHARVGMS